MSLIFGKSCNARLGRLVFIGHLSLLFLVNINLAFIPEAEWVANLGKAQGLHVDRMAQEMIPPAGTTVDMNALRTPESLPTHQVPPQAQAPPIAEKENFWSKLSKFWKWMTTSLIPEDREKPIEVAKDVSGGTSSEAEALDAGKLHGLPVTKDKDAGPVGALDTENEVGDALRNKPTHQVPPQEEVLPIVEKNNFRSNLPRFWKWLKKIFLPKRHEKPIEVPKEVSGGTSPEAAALDAGKLKLPVLKDKDADLVTENEVEAALRKKPLSMGEKFWKWFTTDRTYRKNTGVKFPGMRHLRDQFEGPWEKWTKMRYNPRTPTETREHPISSMRYLGDELVKDEYAAQRNWLGKLEAAGAAKLQKDALSTELFFKLVTRLSEQEKQGAEFQKDVIKIGQEAAEDFKGEAYLKFELRRIMEEFYESKHMGGVVGTRYDVDFYKQPLSPLLLLKERPALSPELLVYEPRYRAAVKHFKETRETIAAIKDYLEEFDKIVIAHRNYAADVLKYFENLDKIKDRKFLTDIAREGLKNEELEAIKSKVFEKVNKENSET
ncbi:hypothetical protein Pst134EA_024216 [Puccinia striiformis f. sp. tritici]|uniref:hypothetical protein n=1 Tax=Puccinia striiformis f. sp. tritici TaxID=168172 RepID=UPI002008AE78|nr:hypothetical protein Pst134EA_024216 [Puccinia striiformis f. sp. tritici]KAH9453340.1 hypothetical protein Pst134EA_024216 [Puccinia striiformis f. sp. tritici]